MTSAELVVDSAPISRERMLEIVEELDDARTKHTFIKPSDLDDSASRAGVAASLLEELGYLRKRSSSTYRIDISEEERWERFVENLRRLESQPS